MHHVYDAFAPPCGTGAPQQPYSAFFKYHHVCAALPPSDQRHVQIAVDTHE
jgi:hypothetical protein